MKIIGISGSPRDKNTNCMLRTVLDATNQKYELILLKDKKIQPCVACRKCSETNKCIINDDMHEIYDKLSEADIIVLGSPTYFDNVTGIMKNFIDRCLPFYAPRKLKDKKVALVAVGNSDDNSVKGCIRALEGFCKHMGFQIIESVYATNDNTQAKEGELIQLGKKLTS